MRAGFRINLRGSNVHFGFDPDMICFGKAIANGHPLAALVGIDDLKQSAERVYFTGTQFFSAPPMAAAIATLDELQKVDAPEKLIQYGEKLNKRLVDIKNAYPILKVDNERNIRELVSFLQSFNNQKLIGRNVEFDYLHTHKIMDRAKYLVNTFDF